MGTCCMCGEYEWPDPQKGVWATGGKEYCVFHAPKGEKWKEKGGNEQYTDEEFNGLVFSRIAATKEAIAAGNVRAECTLSGVVIPGGIYFQQYGKGNPLPGINFDGATFSGDAWFTGATFSGGAWFRNTTFSGEAVFSGATFNGEAGFSAATFSREAWFSEATFSREAEFSGATFSGEAEFHAATFGGHAFFFSVKAGGKSLLLHSLSASTLQHLRLTPLDLPAFSFLGCEWPDRLGMETYETSDASKLKAREDLYRAMKQRAAGEHDQPQVSRWHFREKLMQLKQLLNNERSNILIEVVEDREAKWYARAWAWLKLLALPPYWPKRSLLGMYWAFSGFGEREIRAGIWLAIFVALSFLANSIKEPVVWSELPGSAAIEYTLESIPFAKDLKGYGWVRLARGVWQLLIAIQFTLFALAVRNRFRR